MINPTTYYYVCLYPSCFVKEIGNNCSRNVLVVKANLIQSALNIMWSNFIYSLFVSAQSSPES